MELYTLPEKKSGFRVLGKMYAGGRCGMWGLTNIEKGGFLGSWEWGDGGKGVMGQRVGGMVGG
jgi:hypothetical protein